MKLSERVKQDTDEIVSKYKEQGVDVVLNGIYELSFVYQVEWYFTDIKENVDEDDLKFFDVLRDYEGNIPGDIFAGYLDYSDPDDFNFNSYNGIDSIVRYFVEQLTKNEENAI